MFKKIFSPLILISIVMAIQADSSQIIKPGAQDTGSGASAAVSIWYVGGIGGSWLAVGQPNTLDRNDRAVIRFDLARFIAAGKIKHAVLRFKIEPFTQGETFQLEHFTIERLSLSGNDLNSQQIESVRNFEVKPKTVSGSESAFNVTAAVNKDLAAGFGYVTFRVKSINAEKFGNPNNKPGGITIIKESIELEVKE